MAFTVFSPAKVNLFLAVTGRRTDGFHDLLSIAAPLDFGDELSVELASATGGARFTLTCDHPDVPLDASNLVLKAAEAFAAATDWRQAVRFHLRKRVPMGAGLGGGSSNAVAALKALNQLAGGPLNSSQLTDIAARLGSDCVLFLQDGPCVMRGRGERLEGLAPSVAERLRGSRLLLFKPSFGIATPWAYGRMVARGSDYLPAREAELRWQRWRDSREGLEALLFNNMEPAAFEKYVALPLLLGRLREEFGVAAAMSGSGSACFAVLPRDADAALVDALRACVQAAWGSTVFLQETRLT